MHGGRFASLVCLGTLLVQGDLAAQLETDTNIVTGLDISDSIGRHEEWLERVGTARGLASQTFTEAVLSGRHGRVGVAVFAWSSQGCPLLVGWDVIGTMDDAARIADRLEAIPLIDFNRARVGRHQDQSVGEDRLTDLSEAIDCGRSLLADAPFQTGQSVLNIVGDGIDNFGEGSAAARDRAVAAGITVNGVVIGGSPEVVSYYRDHVIGGDGAFVMDIADPSTVVDAMTRKFLLDVAFAIQ
jgi:Ca-activated chloride channel homolog